MSEAPNTQFIRSLDDDELKHRLYAEATACLDRIAGPVFAPVEVIAQARKNEAQAALALVQAYVTIAKPPRDLGRRR